MSQLQSEYLQKCSNSMQTKARLASEAAGLSLGSYRASAAHRALDTENRQDTASALRRPPGWGRHARDVIERTRAWGKNNLKAVCVREASPRPEGRRGHHSKHRGRVLWRNTRPARARLLPARPAAHGAPTCWCVCAGRGSPRGPQARGWEGRGLGRPEGYFSPQTWWAAGQGAVPGWKPEAPGTREPQPHSRRQEL